MKVKQSVDDEQIHSLDVTQHWHIKDVYTFTRK